MELERPRIRNAAELGFESQVLGKGVARTHALKALIILGFLRGLSVRDVEALLEEALGEQVVGKSTVARVCQDTRARYRAWCERRLDEFDLIYRYLDAIYLKLRPDDEPAEGVLVAWGLTLEGQKVLLGLQLGSRPRAGKVAAPSRCPPSSATCSSCMAWTNGPPECSADPPLSGPASPGRPSGGRTWTFPGSRPTSAGTPTRAS